MKSDYQIKLSTVSRRGSVLVLMAIVLVTLLTILAIAVNTMWFQLKATQAQSSADLSAISTLRHWVDNQDSELGLDVSQNLGAEILSLNQGFKADVSRVEFGFLDDPDIHDPVFTQDNRAITAVHVGRSTTVESDVPVFLSSFFGREYQTISAEAVTNYRPIEVILCLDASRSMNMGAPGSIHIPPSEGSRWFKLLDALEVFFAVVKEKNPNTRVALVTFGGGAYNKKAYSPLDDDYSRKELEFHSIHNNKIPAVLDVYATYPALGYGTFIYDTIDDCMDMMDDSSNPAANRFIILLSDGEQVTVKEKRDEPYVAARRAAAAGIPIHTINFRETDQNKDLEAVASVTGGDSYNAKNEKDLDEVFAELAEKFSVSLKR